MTDRKQTRDELELKIDNLKTQLRESMHEAMRIGLENKELRKELEHLRRKVAHGCTDAACKDCDA